MDDLDSKMKQEIKKVKEKYDIMVMKIKEKYRVLKKGQPKTRKSIPKTVKDRVWDTCIGKERGVGPCYCCGVEIDSKKFDCGHIVSVANGGLDIVENLKPLCGTCNKSMGTQNLEEFKTKYFPGRITIYQKLVNGFY
jgi:5-methylcytosine-specific restriction endonuclease McrA